MVLGLCCVWFGTREIVLVILAGCSLAGTQNRPERPAARQTRLDALQSAWEPARLRSLHALPLVTPCHLSRHRRVSAGAVALGEGLHAGSHHT